MECRYNASIMSLYSISHKKYSSRTKLRVKLTEGTPYLALLGELSDVCSEDCKQNNWPRYKGTALHMWSCVVSWPNFPSLWNLLYLTYYNHGYYMYHGTSFLLCDNGCTCCLDTFFCIRCKSLARITSGLFQALYLAIFSFVLWIIYFRSFVLFHC